MNKGCMSEMSIQLVYNKIREVSAHGPGNRPVIYVDKLAAEIGKKIAEVKPFLLHLEKMRLIMSTNNYMIDLKLTVLGHEWSMMPR